MTDQPVPSADGPHELLAAVRDLTQRVRRVQRGTWFPLLVLAAVILISIPLYRWAPRHLGPCRPGPQDTSFCAGTIPSVLVYWPLALVLAYAAVAGFYVRLSRRRGVGTPVRPYVVTGIVVALLAAGASLWRALHPLLPSPTGRSLGTLPPHHYVFGLATPVAAIGLALLVLTWVERNRALLAFSVVYLAVVLVQGNRVIHSTSPWYFLPDLLVPAGVLLAGSAGFALFRSAAQRDAR